MTQIIDVAVGVIYNSAGELLISKRSDERRQGGLWEFPGGKVELGETVQEALARELMEEVGLEIGQAEPLLTYCHTYKDCTVKLHVFAVGPFNQPIRHLEGQEAKWVNVASLSRYPFMEANERIIKAIKQYLAPRFAA